MELDIRRLELFVEPRDYYRAGDEVKCSILVVLKGVLKLKYLELKAIGEIYANIGQKHQTAYLLEKYFDPINLAESDELVHGIFRIPFSFILNGSLLPSFKGEHGHVKYYITAHITKFGFYRKATQVFHVTTTSNVSVPTGSLVPLSFTREKVMRTLGLKTGSIRLSVHLDKNKYSPGENMRINYHVDNRSLEKIAIHLDLRQACKYMCNFYHATHYNTTTFSYSSECNINKSHSGDIFMLIPEDTVPTFDSAYISLKYELIFLIRFGEEFKNCDKLSVEIG